MGNTDNIRAIALKNVGRLFKCKGRGDFDWRKELDDFDKALYAIEDLFDPKWTALEEMLSEEADAFFGILREVSYVHYYGY